MQMNYMGSITLKTAVSLSRNTVAWNVLKELTPKVGSSYLLNQGFHKVWMDKEYNAIAIGGFTYGVSTEEMAGAYATIANDGEYRRVTCVSQIKDTRGASCSFIHSSFKHIRHHPARFSIIYLLPPAR